ncbi:transposase orfB, IS3 family domain protein [Mycobacterium xenopi 3993]|nr:transposase orfB, IS3 family domain protein [Mycobacterium xenopi 3993]
MRFQQGRRLGQRPRATTELVCSALDYALWSRDIRDGQLIHHSDKGCQYTSVRFTRTSAFPGTCLSGIRQVYLEIGNPSG